MPDPTDISEPAIEPSRAGNPSRPVRKPENLWLNLLCNVVLPGLIMAKLSRPERLGPVWALVIGVSLPLGYGIYDLVVRRKVNIFSVVGFLSVALTGGLGLAKASAMTFAIKEAAIPAVFGLGALASLRTRQPLVKEMLLNESVVDVAKVESALAARGTRPAFERLLVTCTWYMTAGFCVSAVLNFALARFLLKAQPGTSEFTEQLGIMNWWSWPVITVPFLAIMIVAMMKLIRGIHGLTGLDLEAIMHARPEKPGKA